MYGLLGGKDENDNLVFRTKCFDKHKSLLLTTHIDTVAHTGKIKPKIEGEKIRSDGRTILGADPKSGIASIITILDYLKSRNKELKNLEFIFSTNEEEGDHTLQYADIKSKKALVLDNAAPVNEIIYKGPYAKVFEIEVFGKSVYAQLDYSKGANAIVTLAEIIKNIDWGFYKEGCVANTGTIKGGEATTLVPKYAILKGNIYCFKEKDLNQYIRNINKAGVKADKKYKTKTKVKILENYKGVRADLRGNFVEEIKEIYKKNGVRIKFKEMLVISSNNCLGEKNVESINVGLGYKNCHTVKEEQSLQELTRFTYILLSILEKNYIK
ncbi:MAG: M20/M25/M40 family metallo-hydrolase [Patescibacteria group bacterium]|nr:M20/M25/M40 family metallo-hydrolase [Patescibacteria group bacterium]